MLTSGDFQGEAVGVAVRRMNADIRELTELRDAHRQSNQALAAALRALSPATTSHARIDPVTQLANAEWQLRVAAILDLPLDDCASRNLLVETCLQMALDDPDARVRGTAWWTVCLAWQNTDLNEMITEATNRRLMQRFCGAPADSRAPAAPRLWLRSLESAVRFMEWDLGARAADREYIRTHAGADAAAIEAGWRPAQAFLEHADPGHRLAALWAIGRTGTQASAAADKVRQLMVSDPDQEVRARAVRTYGGLHAATGNPEAQRQLAAVALNESQRRGLRFSAYDALLSVRGVAFADLPLQRARREAPAKLAQLDAGGADAEWPVQIAWDLVRECATRGA